jgi:hypothetical protein
MNSNDASIPAKGPFGVSIRAQTVVSGFDTGRLFLMGKTE